MVFLLATCAHPQNSQFLFDADGNLVVQIAEISALPQIIGQPQNQIAAPGELASFSVAAADTRALTYEWRFNGAPLGGSATNDALLLQNVTTNNEGPYTVVLSNPSGSVTSAPALLMIDSDADGIADSWERTYFTNLAQNATADFDHDGASNLQEFLDGTNPTNSVSFATASSFPPTVERSSRRRTNRPTPMAISSRSPPSVRAMRRFVPGSETSPRAATPSRS